MLGIVSNVVPIYNVISYFIFPGIHMYRTEHAASDLVNAVMGLMGITSRIFLDGWGASSL